MNKCFQHMLVFINNLLCIYLLYTFKRFVKMVCMSGNSILSAAEKQQRYRARREGDPERRQQYLNKEMDGWTRDRQEGIKK